MKHTKKSPEERARRIEKIEALGFEIDHNERGHITLHGRLCAVDFSAVDEEKFAEYAFGQIFGYGWSHGRNELRADYVKLMQPDRTSIIGA